MGIALPTFEYGVSISGSKAATPPMVAAAIDNSGAPTANVPAIAPPIKCVRQSKTIPHFQLISLFLSRGNSNSIFPSLRTRTASNFLPALDLNPLIIEVFPFFSNSCA